MEKKNKQISYDKECFNPLFFVLDALLKRGVKQILVYGGKGSAKTISISQTIAKRVYERKENAIMYRKEGSTVKKTLKRSLVKAINGTRFKKSQKGLDRKFKIQEWIIRSVRGSEMALSGLDDASKVKGIEGYHWMYLDEMNQFDHGDYLEADGAFRGDIVRAFFGSWNPVDINNWVKTKVVDMIEWEDSDLTLPSPHSFVKVSKDGKYALIKTVYQDNYYIVGSPCGKYGYRDQDTIDKYERMKLIDEHWYRVNVLGEWGVIKPDNPFFYKYDRTKHLESGIEFNDNLPIALSFDFNVKHSCLIGQFSFYDRYVRIIKEMRSNDLIAMVSEIVNKYGKHRHYVITGDSTGNNRNALTTGNIGAWDQIRQFLKIAGIPEQNVTFVVGRSNLTHINSRVVNNAIMYMENDYKIDPDGCPETVADIERMMSGTDGGYDKKHAEKNNYGHLGDCFRYFNDDFLVQFYESYDIVKYNEY